MKKSEETLNFKLINRVVLLIGILVGVQVIKICFPIIKPVISALNLIISPFIIAISLAYLLNPLVDFFCRLHFKRSYAILVTFVSIVGGLFYAIFSLIPYLIVNIQEVLNSMPMLIEKVELLISNLNLDYIDIYKFDFSSLFSENSKFFTLFSSFLSRAGSWLSSASSSFTMIIGMLFLVPILLYYILNNFYELRNRIKNYLITHRHIQFFNILKESEEVVRGYVSGTLAVSLALSIIASIYFALIGLDNAVVFGVLIGFLNIIPYVGQIFGTIPAALFGLTVSIWTPVYVIIGVLALNFIEGNFIKPLVFSKAVDFHPIILLTLIIIGGQIFGVIGMIFIIPIAGIIKIILRYSKDVYFEYRSKKNNELN